MVADAFAGVADGELPEAGFAGAGVLLLSLPPGEEDEEDEEEDWSAEVAAAGFFSTAAESVDDPSLPPVLPSLPLDLESLR